MFESHLGEQKVINLKAYWWSGFDKVKYIIEHERNKCPKREKKKVMHDYAILSVALDQISIFYVLTGS